MRRLRMACLIGAIVATIVVSGVPASSAGFALPPGSSAYGQTRVSWARALVQWQLGDASNPLIAAAVDGDCGEVMGHVYFMAAPIEEGLDVSCDVPVGVPILVSHASYFYWADPGQTDQELEEAAAAGFVPDESSLVLDGSALPLATTNTGAFDVDSQPGGFYDSVIGLGTGPIRSAISGQFTIIRPLPPGEHQLDAYVDFTGVGGPILSATYHVNVG